MWSVRPPPAGSAACAAIRSPMRRTISVAGCCGGRSFPVASASVFTCVKTGNTASKVVVTAHVPHRMHCQVLRQQKPS